MKKLFKKTEGFTLVELIVVIAILGILAGVGTVGYSGYIKKANIAADEQLLAALNQAFAAACIENGEDQKNVAKADDVMTADHKVTGVTVTDHSKADAIVASFAKYFAGNEDTAFKVVEELKYSKQLGFYSDLLAGSNSYAFGDSTVTISAADKAILSGDNAFTAMGSAALLSEVGTVETYLSDAVIGADVLDEVKDSEEFLLALGAYAGIEEVEGKDYLDVVWDYSQKSENEGAVNNAIIMYAASQAANATDAQIDNLFTYVENQGLTGRIEGATDAETMANAALAYGMYTSYAQRNGKTTTNVTDFFNCVNNDQKAFTDYVASAEGQADLEAYMAAMNMISDNTSNTAVTSSILTNGISGNTALADLMLEIMGN